MKRQSEQSIQGRIKRKHWLVGLFLFMVITTVMWCAFWLNYLPPERIDVFPGSGDAVVGHLPNMPVEEIMAQMQREADKQVLSFKINGRPVFERGESAGTLRIENPQHNAYPFVVEIVLEETGEAIYNSGGVLPNHYISEGKLEVILPKGEHDATAFIHAYDPETSQYSGKAVVALTLVIEN